MNDSLKFALMKIYMHVPFRATRDFTSDSPCAWTSLWSTANEFIPSINFNNLSFETRIRIETHFFLGNPAAEPAVSPAAKAKPGTVSSASLSDL